VDDVAAASGELQDALGELEDGVLFGVPEVNDFPREAIGFHEADESRDQVAHVTERAGLVPRAVDGDGFSPQCLHAEVGDDAAIGGVGAGTVGIEDAGDAGVELVLADVLADEGFCEAFAFVVAGAGPVGVDVSPIVFGLGMDEGIAVDLAGGRLEEPGPVVARQLEGMVGAVAVDHEGFDRVAAVAFRAGGTGEVVDTVELFHREFGAERLAHVLREELEVVVPMVVIEVGGDPGEEVVGDDDGVTLLQEAIDEVAADEAGAAGNEDVHEGPSALGVPPPFR
jgi:hypothetical protein